MKLRLLEKPFYRPATAGNDPQEDGYAFNESAGIAVVYDGVSEPYSNSHPRIDYNGNGMTGGQMAGQWVKIAVEAAEPGDRLQDVLLEANQQILDSHLKAGLDPATKAVGGVCLAACQVLAGKLTLITVADAWANVRHRRGSWQFYTNIDLPAYELEESGNVVFAAFKKLNNGHIGATWVDYFTYFTKQQYFRANRHKNEGGHGMVNGNPAVQEYWTCFEGEATEYNRIALGSDGMLSSSDAHPDRRSSLSEVIGAQLSMSKQPAAAVYGLAASKPSDPHIGAGKRPEATMLYLAIDCPR